MVTLYHNNFNKATRGVVYLFLTNQITIYLLQLGSNNTYIVLSWAVFIIPQDTTQSMPHEVMMILDETPKLKKFIFNPIYDKGVKRVPGIGKVYGDRLIAAGFHKAKSLLDKFLALEKNESSFKHWLKETCDANVRSQNECYFALNKWCKLHLP